VKQPLYLDAYEPLPGMVVLDRQKKGPVFTGITSFFTVPARST